MSAPKRRVLVIGQTPPPFHGQAIAVQMLLAGDYGRIELSHVPMNFSRTVEEIGRLRVRKLVELPLLVARILKARVCTGAQVLYYPPYCAERVPLVRDLVVLTCCRWAFRSTVLHLHSTGFISVYGDLGRAWRFAFRRAYFHPDVAIALSGRSRSDAEFLLARHVAVVPNGVPDDAVSFGRLSRSQGELPVVLFTGVVRPSKGVLELLEACARLRDGGWPARVKLMGAVQPVEFGPELSARIDELGLSGEVELLGSRTGDEKWRMFRQADVFCLPTFFDNFPLVVLEAMEFGLPVVCTPCGSLAEIVVEGETGFLVEAGDVPALASRLSTLLSSPELRDSMGAAGRRRYLERFTVEHYRRGVEAAVCLA